MADKRYVFLSYGRKDVYPQGATNAVEQEAHFPIVEKVYRHLYGLRDSIGLEPWFDKLCLTHDRQFTDSINHAIEQSDYMLLFIGKHSMGSPWCEREWKHALANCVPVIPILLEGSWGDADIQAAYPAQILSVDGIDPKDANGKLNEDYLLKRVMNVVEQKPAPLATARGARKLPEHYIERKQYVDALKKELVVNDRNYAQRKNIVGITSQQETAALQGIGGIGKTTLALAVCADCEVRRGFDQIFWLEAGPQTEAEDAARLMQIIGMQMGDSAENYKDVQSARASLHRYLNGKRSLLVLDDVWAEGLVDQFLWAGADCRLLVTTRNKSLVEHPQQVAKLGTEEGLRLLATIFDPLNPDMTKLNDDHKAIVKMLDGYTLAIAIAGKWLMKYGHQRAETYLTRLKGGESDLFKQLEISKSDKNANLELSLSLSYDDLASDEQKRFRSLGIFVAGSSYPLEALDALWGKKDSFIEAQQFVDVGLLEIVSENRYTQHSLVRAYAKALLDIAGETETVFAIFADFYIQMANQFKELPREEWSLLDSDIPNIHSLGDKLVQLTDIGMQGDLERALAFAYNITTYLAHQREVRRIQWLDMGLNAVRNLQVNDAQEAESKEKESLFLHEIGVQFERIDERDKAFEYYQQSLQIDTEIKDTEAAIATLNNIGEILRQQNSLNLALDYFNQALLLVYQNGNSSQEATILNNIALTWVELGETRKALKQFEKVRVMLHREGNYVLEAMTFNNMGETWRRIGKSYRALEYFKRALPIFKQIGDRNGEAAILNNMGLAWAILKQYQKSIEAFLQVISIQKELDAKEKEAITSNSLAAVYEAVGNIDQAVIYASHSIELIEPIEYLDSSDYKKYLEHLLQKRRSK